jgi:hypothetical protein
MVPLGGIFRVKGDAYHALFSIVPVYSSNYIVKNILSGVAFCRSHDTKSWIDVGFIAAGFGEAGFQINGVENLSGATEK